MILFLPLHRTRRGKERLQTLGILQDAAGAGSVQLIYHSISPLHWGAFAHAREAPRFLGERVLDKERLLIALATVVSLSIAVWVVYELINGVGLVVKIALIGMVVAAVGLEIFVLLATIGVRIINRLAAKQAGWCWSENKRPPIR